MVMGLLKIIKEAIRVITIKKGGGRCGSKERYGCGNIVAIWECSGGRDA